MNDDLISRQAAIARMTSMNDDEMQIVRHGYWISDNCRPKSTLYRCSVCGEIAHDRPYGALKREPKKYCKMRYCPHCGAKMEVDCNA